MLTNLEADSAKGGLMKEKDLSQDQLDIIQSASVGNAGAVRDVGTVDLALTVTIPPPTRLLQRVRQFSVRPGLPKHPATVL